VGWGEERACRRAPEKAATWGGARGQLWAATWDVPKVRARALQSAGEAEAGWVVESALGSALGLGLALGERKARGWVQRWEVGSGAELEAGKEMKRESVKAPATVSEWAGEKAEEKATAKARTLALATETKVAETSAAAWA